MRFFYFILIAVFLALSTTELSAITFIGGYEDNIWTDYRNWDTNQVPGAGDIAEVPSDKTVVVNGAISVGTLILNGSLSSDGDPGSQLTIIAGFTWQQGSVTVPVFLLNGCSALWTGNLGLGADLTNHGEVNCDANVTFDYHKIDNYGIFNVTGAHTFGVYHAPVSFENHGLLKKPLIDGSVFNIGVLLNNHSDGDILIENGELYASIHTVNYGDVNILSGAVYRTHTLDVFSPSTFTGAGKLRVTGNGMNCLNTSPVTIDCEEFELSANGTFDSGEIHFANHVVLISGGIQNPVFFDAGCVVDVNPGGSPGLSSLVTNNGTVNFNANFTFSYGELVNNGLINLTGAYTLGIYAASAGITNHGTVKKTTASSGTFTFNGPPLNNHNDGDVIVQSGELNISANFVNYGNVTIEADATLRTSVNHTVHDGATYAGAGTLVIAGNGLFANNSTPVTLNQEHLQISSSFLSSGSIVLTGDVTWSGGSFNIPVEIATGCVVNLNSGAGGIGGQTTTVHGVLNVNAHFTLSAGQINVEAGGQMLLNGDFNIGIYYGTPGIFNHGTVKKVSGTGVYNMGVPLTNYSDGNVIIETGTLYVASEFKNSGVLSVAENARFKTNLTTVFDGAAFNGLGTYEISNNGFNANNTANVAFDVANVEITANMNGSGAITFSGAIDWKSGTIGNNFILSPGAQMTVSTAGFHNISGILTSNGLINQQAAFGVSGTLVNNGALNLLAGSAINFNGVIQNAGTITKPAGGSFTMNPFMVNTGIITLDGDQTTLKGLSNGGSIDVAANSQALLDYGYATNSFETNGVITGDGTFFQQGNVEVNADQTILVQNYQLSGNLTGLFNLTFPNLLQTQGTPQVNNGIIITSSGLMQTAGMYLNGNITSAGTINCNGNILMDPMAYITNNGTFNITEASVLGAPYNYYSSGTFNNNATLTHNTSGTSQLNLTLNNAAAASVTVQTGMLEVYKFENNGAATVLADATLTVRDGHNFNTGSVAGAGTFRIAGQGWYLSNTLLVNGLIFEIDANLSGAPGAQLQILGLGNWLSGEISVPVLIANTGTFNIDGVYGSKTITGELTNNGVVNSNAYWTAGANVLNNNQINIGENGGFGNYSGVALTNASGASIQVLNATYGVYVYIDIVNHGTISLVESILYLNGALENDGTLTVPAGNTLALGGTSHFAMGTAMDISGVLIVNYELTIDIDLPFSGENFELSGDLLGSHLLTINTHMDWNNGLIDGNLTVTNGAILVIGYGGGGGGGSKTAKNTYLLKKSAPQMAYMPTYGRVLKGILLNHGTIQHNDYIELDGGSLSNIGEMNTDGASIYQYYGGNPGNLVNTGIWNINSSMGCYVPSTNNGALNGNGYYLTFEPELTNNGTVAPGTPIGEMAFQHQFNNGTLLNIELESSNGPGIGHDYVLAEETINLSGTLTVTEIGSLLNGEYVILHCNGGSGCLTGAFSTVNLPAEYTIDYTDEEVVLTKGTPASVTPADTVICSGNPVTLTASAGESYQWSTGETTQSITVYPYDNSNYFVTVYDASGGGSLGSATVQVNYAPYGYVYPGYSQLCSGEEATLTVYGDAELTYLWNTGETIESITVAPDTPAYYSVILTNASGCSTVAYATVEGSNNPPLVPEITGIPNAMCGADPGIYLSTYQDGVSGEWTGNGVYYGYYFDPYGLQGPQVLTFTPYSGQCAVSTTWTIDVTNGIFYLDSDEDGYGDPFNALSTCSQPSGYVADNTDCDDSNAAIHPGAAEICNDIDDNCDGQTDEGVQLTFYADTDADGYGDAAATTLACSAPLGYVSDNTDCDDTNAAIHPGATETCNDIDDNCDGQTDEGAQLTFYADTDADGYGDATATTLACSAPLGYVSDNTDCDDTNAAIHPGAAETCNGIDDDCDGQTDEGVQLTFYADTDGDGYGDAAATTLACSAPLGYVSDNTDCDDMNAAIHPGAAETCNSIDDDCDGQTDEGVQLTFYADTDGDGYGDATVTTLACSAPLGYVSDNTDCDDTNAAIHPGAAETCNGIDDDCDGQTDEGATTVFYADADGDDYGDPNNFTYACTMPLGYIDNNLDCDDHDADVNPGSMELCNGIDDNCNGQIDEGVQATFYADSDGDGFGDPNSPIEACTPPSGFVSNSTDCNDNDAQVHPGAAETCNSIDDNCDGQIDEGGVCDGDGDGYTVAQGDCDDSNPNINPGALEVCNSVDDDCDGLIDENVGFTWYADTDNDNYGDPNESVVACDQPIGYVLDNQDCDDTNASIHPGAAEICNNALDDDCDGQIDESTLSLSLNAGVILCNGGSTTLAASAAGGVAPYQYSFDGSSWRTTSTNIVGAGLHTVTVKDANDCTSTETIYINEPDAILIDPVVVTHVLCGGGNTGAINITVSGGTPAYTYRWSNNKLTEDITNLAAGTYTVTTTDANGCTAVVAAIVNPRLTVTMSKTNVTCHGGSDGTATVIPAGGTPFYTFLWNNGETTQTITGLTAGTYRATVTDETGCSRAASVNVGQPAAINISGIVQNVTCNGFNNGSIAVTINNGVAPFTYDWNDGVHTEDRTNIGPGSYTLSVTDQNGCTRTKSFVVTEPALLTVSFSIKDVTCNGFENGEITATASGGKRFPNNNLCNGERYCYNWDNGATTRKITGLAPGDYGLIVTDLNGCTVDGLVTITEPDTLELTHVAQEQLPNGRYKLTLTAEGGTTPYKYKRFPGSGYQNTNVFNNVPVGTYHMIVRDANLCEDTLIVQVPGGSAREESDTRADDSIEQSVENSEAQNVDLFPNPATNMFILKLNGVPAFGSIRVFDLQGKLIVEQPIVQESNQYQFNLNGWSTGVYLIQIQTQNERIVKRLVVGGR